MSESSSDSQRKWCLACGDDISTTPGRRLVQSDKIRPLFIRVFNDELKKFDCQQDDELCNQLIHNRGMVCRTCFTKYERCWKILRGIMENMHKAILESTDLQIVNVDSNAPSDVAGATGDEPTPKRPRHSAQPVNSCNSGGSPDVLVSVCE